MKYGSITIGTPEGKMALRSGEVSLVRPKTCLAAGKMLATVFFNWKARLLIDFLHERLTVDDTHYYQLLDSAKPPTGINDATSTSEM